MPGSWNPATYRERARKWCEEAEALPPGRDRDASLALANGYAALVAIIERFPENAEVQSAPSMASQT
jgi:hypothetical protein